MQRPSPTSRPFPLFVPPRLGKRALYESVEPRLRRLVAAQLGVPCAELRAEVSLTDDLAADSLDVIDLALAIEAAFSVTLPERTLEAIRTYGDIVEATSALVAGASATEEEPAPPPVVLAAISRAGTLGEAALRRAVPLTPYLTQMIGEDAVRAGHGARLDLVAPAGTSDDGLATIRERFSWLAGRGVELRVGRRSAPGAPEEDRDEEHAAV